MNFKEKTVWQTTGSRDMAVEIVKWSNPEGKTMWNYYVFIFKDETSPDVWEKVIAGEVGVGGWNYFASALANCDWHNGITFGERVVPNEFTPRLREHVKLGCDYNHIWDEGRCYTFEMVAADAQVTVEDIKLTIKALAERNLNPSTDGAVL